MLGAAPESCVPPRPRQSAISSTGAPLTRQPAQCERLVTVLDYYDPHRLTVGAGIRKAHRTHKLDDHRQTAIT